MKIEFQPKPNPRKARNFNDLEGQQFGKLLVVGYAGRDTLTRWVCKCDCGTLCVKSMNALKAYPVNHCGCSRPHKRARPEFRSHKVDVPEFRVWMSMKERCGNPKLGAYQNYGGRGISVCLRWLESFDNFLADLGPRLSDQHSLERVDNNGNYEPSNCVWATRSEQNNNRRNNRLITLNGDTKTLTQWCKERHISFNKVNGRLRIGWSAEKALTA